jgi:hypothetical protein
MGGTPTGLALDGGRSPAVSGACEPRHEGADGLGADGPKAHEPDDRALPRILTPLDEVPTARALTVGPMLSERVATGRSRRIADIADRPAACQVGG